MVKIVVIDSGLDKQYQSDRIVKGIAVSEGLNGLSVTDDYYDCVGHGTAIIDLILQNNPDVEIIPVKICDDTIHTSLERLCFALKYIIDFVDFDIIQASLGVTTYSCELHDYIKHIVHDMHKTVISAFDNSGAISYPAAFEETIGIDINRLYRNNEEYDISFGGLVDISGAEVYYRTAFLDGKKTVIHGTSLLASYFTAVIASLWKPEITKDEIMEYLKKSANRVYEYKSDYLAPLVFLENVHKAVVFPFNKEVHSLAAFEDLVRFEIIGYYDIKHKFLLGRKIKEVLGYSENEKIIQNITNLEWDDSFDTIILGHLGEISSILKKDMLWELIEKCRTHKKRVFCFDNLYKIISNYRNSLEVFCPYEINHVSYERMEGKMNIPHIPVLEVCGTSSKQGKYSVQLEIMKEFKKRGISVSGLGTEPSAPLLGFEECVPFGYGSYDAIAGNELVKYCNSLIWKIEKNKPEIIITGSQSGMISNLLFHERSLLLNQYGFLLGTNPDGVILCINAVDDIDYVRRTILFIESALGNKVFSIVLCDGEKMYSSNVFLKNIENHSNLNTFVCENEFQVPVFTMPEFDAEKMVDTIIKFYS